VALAGAGVFVVIVGWWWLVPSCDSLGFVVMGILLAMVVFRMLDQREIDLCEQDVRRYREGLCVACGYDLRACGARCSECGRPIDRAEQPLPAPSRRSTVWQPAPEVGQAAFILRVRGPTPAEVWGDARRARIAALMAAACARGAGWPTDHFRPDDSFAMMIDDWEGMGWFEFVMTVDRELKIRVDSRLGRFLTLTFSAVVDDVSADLVAGKGPGAVREGALSDAAGKPLG
jgi:hypothetical protein